MKNGSDKNEITKKGEKERERGKTQKEGELSSIQVDRLDIG